MTSSPGCQGGEEDHGAAGAAAATAGPAPRQLRVSRLTRRRHEGGGRERDGMKECGMNEEVWKAGRRRGAREGGMEEEICSYNWGKADEAGVTFLVALARSIMFIALVK